MARLTSFQFISLDGCFQDADADTSWHQHDAEGSEYSVQSLAHGNTLLFGRVTYQMMASFWPSELAAQRFPEVARAMNAANKLVFSRTLDAATWANSTLVAEDAVARVRRLKRESASDLTLLGSGSLFAQFANAKLVDRFELLLDPLVLGRGRQLFEGVTQTLPLTLQSARPFRNGAVLLSYLPR